MSGLDRSPTANIGSWLTARAASEGDRIALVAAGEVPEDDRAISFAELNALANAVAARLQQAGVGPGERVALALPSEPLYLAVYFAVAKLGAILLPLNTRLRAAELRFQLEDSEPRVAVGVAAAALPADWTGETLSREELLEQLPREAGEPALGPGGEAAHVLMYTSGTTGRPKGALLPHRKTLYNTLNAEIYFGLTRDDVIVAPIPLFHSYGLKILSVPALFAGARVALVDHFDPVGLQARVAHERATILGAVPVMYQRMVRAGIRREQLESLRFAFSAGAAIDVATIRAFHREGVALKQGYGQTETSILCCLDDADTQRKAGSVGRPVAHGEVRVADERGEAVPSGQRGEVMVRGPIVMLGYWRREQETAEARVAGWHRTGDLGVMDDEGFVTLVGRRKEMYISGGENVYPAEVERVLEEHPDVAEAAVVGVADEEWGESGRAYVVPAAEAIDPERVLVWLRDQLAGYKQPREVVVVEALPRTASGKVQKHRLVANG
jgi:fatty-acyl-CoA synthase